MIEANERRKAKESILMSRKLNERQKIFTNIFMTLLKGGRGGGGGGVETKRHMTFFREQIELRVAPKIAGVSH